MAAAVAFLCGVFFAPAQITITPPDGGTNGGTINTNATLDPTNAVLKNIITTLAMTNFGRTVFVATNGNPASTGGMTPFDTVSNAVRFAMANGVDTVIVLPGDHYYRAPTNTVSSAAIMITNYSRHLTIMGLGWNSRLYSDREGTCFMISNTGPVTLQDLNVTGFRNTDVANVFGPGPGNGIAYDANVGDLRFINVRVSDFQRFGLGSFALTPTLYTNNVLISGCVVSNCGSFFPTFLTGLNDGAGFVLGPNSMVENCLVVNCVKGFEIYGNDAAPATNRANAHIRVVNTRFRNILGEHIFNGGYSNNMDVMIKGCSFIDDPGYVRYDGSNYITGGTPVMFSMSLMQNLQFDDNWVQPHYAVGLAIFANAQDNRGARVRRNKFLGMHNPIQAGDATGGTSPGMRDLIIENNDFYDFGGRGIQLIGVRDSIIKNNRFFNGSTNGTLANIYIGGTAPAAHSSNVLIEANQHFDFNTVPGNSYCLEIAAGTIDLKAVDNDWNSFATAAFINGGTNTLFIGRNQIGVGIGTNTPNQRLVVAGNASIIGTNSAKKFHATDGTIATNTLGWWNNGTNLAGLPFGYGLAISNGFLIVTNVAGTNIVGGPGTTTNIATYGNFGYLSRSDLVVQPYGNGDSTLTNYTHFSGSNFTGNITTGFITNHMPSGWVDIHATVNMVEAALPSGNFHIGIRTNGALASRMTILNNGVDFQEYTMQATVYLETNATVSVLVQNGDSAAAGILTSHLLVRSYDQIVTVVAPSSGGSLFASGGDVFVNSLTVTNGISQFVTNLGNGHIVSMAWDGPNTIRWGPTNNGNLTGGGSNPSPGGPARHWLLEVYPGGYTNLTFPGAFQWIDGGPFFDPSRTNIFDLKFTGSNFVAFTVPNGILSGASANISGHWIAPPAGIIGGMFNSQYRSNLTANALFTISNLQHETELEIIANGFQGSIANAESIMWKEGSQPFIETNTTTVLRFWMFGGLTNGMVLSQQLWGFTNGVGISFVKDFVNHTVTIHNTLPAGSGFSVTYNSDQFDFDGTNLTVKASWKGTNGVNYGNFTVTADPETGDPGALAASYISAVRYVDIGVTNLGKAHIATLIWNGPTFVRWNPTNNGVLTGGGSAPILGEASRTWFIEVRPGGYTNLTFPSEFVWLDGGPIISRLKTNVYMAQFTGSNYLAFRVAPGPDDFYIAGANVTFTPDATSKRVTISTAAAGAGVGPTNGLGYLENLYGTAFINDDFAGDVASSKFGREFWTQTLNAGGVSATAGAGAGAPFVIEMITTNTADRAGYHLGVAGGNLLLTNYQSITFLARVSIRNLADGTDRNNSYFGFITPWTSEPTSGVYIRATNNVWEIVTARASSYTVTSTGTNVSADAYLWVGVTLEQNTNAVALIGPSETLLSRVATNTLTVPGDLAVGVGFNMRRTAGTTTRQTNRVDKFMAFSK